MNYVERALTSSLLRAAAAFPALVLTGPRRSGKTTLLQHCFPGADYLLLEAPDVLARVRSDPRSVLAELGRPAILDEIQNAPELLGYLRAEIDGMPEIRGQWLLTGSQEAQLMRGVTESMAGRAAVFQLLPFAHAEDARVSLLGGGFPEVIAAPDARDLWYRSYIQTYLERDVRSVLAVRDLATFGRFLALLATRQGQLLNKTALAAPLGLSVPTLSEWLGVLEVTAQILLVPPFYENFGKRITKAPKLYFADSGLAAHLLGIESEAALGRSPFLGPLFEGLVATEIVKRQIHAGKARAIYHFRDRQGLEVDFLVPLGEQRLALVEAKATRTPGPELAKSLRQLQGSIGEDRATAWLVHERGETPLAASGLGGGARALAWTELASALS
ncbi:ATP-binding protein [bacterium]|nr:ATP-binding protein [bacterium]